MEYNIRYSQAEYIPHIRMDITGEGNHNDAERRQIARRIAYAICFTGGWVVGDVAVYRGDRKIGAWWMVGGQPEWKDGRS